MVLSTAPTRHHLAKSTSAIHAAADAAEPRIRRAMLALFESVQANVPNLDAMIRAGDTNGVWQAVKALSPSTETATALIAAVASAGIRSGMSEAVELKIAFNQPAKEAIEAAARHAGERITLISTKNRAVVRGIVEDGIRLGIHPTRTARQIEQSITLLPNHARSVRRLLLSMEDAGLDQAHIDKVVRRKVAKLKRYRAEMIARTEAIDASNMGQQAIWDKAMDSDLLPADTKKRWVATADACPICLALEAEGPVPVRGTFSNGKQGPTAHPFCRCSKVLAPL